MIEIYIVNMHSLCIVHYCLLEYLYIITVYLLLSTTRISSKVDSTCGHSYDDYSIIVYLSWGFNMI